MYAKNKLVTYFNVGLNKGPFQLTGPLISGDFVQKYSLQNTIDEEKRVWSSSESIVSLKGL